MIFADKDWKKAATILGVLIAVIVLFSYGRETYLYLDQGSACRTQVQDVAAEQVKDRQTMQSHAQSIAVMQAEFAQMQETLNRIEDRVDRIARVTNP